MTSLQQWFISSASSFEAEHGSNYIDVKPVLVAGDVALNVHLPLNGK